MEKALQGISGVLMILIVCGVFMCLSDLKNIWFPGKKDKNRGGKGYGKKWVNNGWRA